MNNPEFNRAYEEQNDREYIANAKFGAIVSIPLQLSCLVMDYFMYPELIGLFIKVRFIIALVTLGVLIWFQSRPKQCPKTLLGITWFTGPLLMVLWMIYAVHDIDGKYANTSPYYAGLNIILLAMGLISPWTYVQNVVITLFTLVAYVVVAVAVNITGAAQPMSVVINNTTFLFLTAAFVVLGSRANAKQRLHEFTLRWELDKSRREVEANNQRLVELDEAKSRFFANISHELRTPLTLMIAPLETLLNHHRARLSADAVALLQTMHGNSLRLLRLINDLLNIVRLESGKLEVRREPVVVDEFVKGLGSAARQMAEDKGIQLSIEVDSALGSVALDRDKTEKILLNLIFNALKFTLKGGTVTVQCRKSSERVVFAVKDTGVGIPKHKLPQVFTRFFQADDSSSRKYQGVGIGLSLVKEFTELQGGTVAVDSVEGQGSTFTVELPYVEVPATGGDTVMFTRPAASEAPTANANAGSQEWLSDLYRRAERAPAQVQEESQTDATPAEADSRPLILVADDEPDMLRFMASQLRAHYRVVKAPDGQRAVDAAIANPPDLVLTDMMMPVKDGLTVCKELRAHPATRSVPVVMITARADEETKLAALGAGANDFLPKPFSITELHVRVKNLLDSARFQSQLERQNIELEATLTELRQTQEQLIMKEKLASLGVWSAGIIHEMNNPLNFARTGLYALRNKDKHLPAGEQADFKELLADIEDGIKRVHLIVSDLRTYAHPGKEDAHEEAPVDEVLRVALRFFSGDVQGNVEVIKNIPPGLTAFVNRNKLIQVLGNLLQNAVDALKTKPFTNGEHPTITISGEAAGSRSRIIIRDNGPGIPAGNLPKIFDPFFTTKEVGKGMGLGLGICYRIVQGFGGSISVRSEAGSFCEFTLDLPAEQPDAGNN